MSNRLRELINKHIVVNGNRGKAQLALAANRSEQMIDRYRKGTSSPGQDVGYQLALACGCSKEDALKLAGEGSSEVKSSRTA